MQNDELESPLLAAPPLPVSGTSPSSREALPDAQRLWDPHLPPPYAPEGAPYRWSPSVRNDPPAPARESRTFHKPFRPRELAAAIAIVAAADIALWARSYDGDSGRIRPGGFGVGILFCSVAGAMVLATKASRKSRRLALVGGLLGLVVVRSVLDPTPGTFFSGLALLATLALALRTRRVFVPEAFTSAIAAVARLPSRVHGAASGIARLAAKAQIGRANVLPIAIPAALLVAFLGVFALANPVLAHALGRTFRAGGGVFGIPGVGRVVFWIATLAGAVVLLRPACPRARGDEDAPVAGEATPTSLLVARNALVVQNVLFFGYNVLDARYLWAGSPPGAMSTQDYAHAGAFWLTIALVMLTGVVGFMFRGPLAQDPRAERTRNLAYAWMGQGVVLALGTYRRIGIHIGHSGLSDLRIVGILGTSLVVGGVALVAWKLRHGKSFTWLLRRQLDVLAVTTVLYTVFPTHLVSAQVNVARVQHGEYRPILHAFRQAHETESSAAYLPLLDHSDLRIRQGVAALLTGERARLQDELASEGTWRERNLAGRLALRALDQSADRIAAELGTADRDEAVRVMLEISTAANEDMSLEEILSIPRAGLREGGYGRRGDVSE